MNDWWAELGADKKIVGRILGNHILLRAEPNNTATIVAYNYENEYVWIQEESQQAVEYNDKPSTWVKMQKLTGAIVGCPDCP